MSIIEYLSNGIYNDKTGVALQNTSPQQVNNDTENNQEIKENRNMNKKQVIRINENQLKRIVTESVKRVLKEESNTPQSLLFSIRAWIKGMHQEIDKFDIANENGRGDIILPQFINNLRNILQQIDDECKELKGLISMQHT